MRIEEFQLLARACQRAELDHPVLQHRLDETAEQSAVSINEELDSFLGAVLRDREQVRLGALESMQPLLMVFDLALLQTCDLAHFAWQNRDTQARVLWHTAEVPRRPSSARVFYLLTSNLAQSLQAVRLLLLHGFEGQARSMFRSFIELADFTLAAAAYTDVYDNYVTTFDDSRQEYQHWRRYLSPAVMRRRLLTLDNELALSEITAIPASEVRDDTYEWFSLFTHVNMVAHLVSAYPTKLGQETLGAISMLGTVGEMSRATLSRALLYLWLFFIYFDQLLWERHGWARFRGWRWRGRYQYRSQVLNSLFRQNYNMLQGIVSDAGA